MFSVQVLSFLLYVCIVSSLIRPYARIESPDSAKKKGAIRKIRKAVNSKNLS